MLGLFKKKQMPTCKQCGMVAVGLNSAGLCPSCAEDKENAVYGLEIVSTGGKEVTTGYDKDGNVLSHTTRAITPEQARKESYNSFRSGTCCVCWDKYKKVDPYDICKDCEQTHITDSVAVFHISQLFALQHKEDIDDYQDALFEAYYENDTDGLHIIASEFKDFCYAVGAAGRVYIENTIYEIRQQEYDKNSLGYVLAMAFDDWEYEYTPTKNKLPGSPIYKLK